MEKVSLKILNSGIILKTFTHVYTRFTLFTYIIESTDLGFTKIATG